MARMDQGGGLAVPITEDMIDNPVNRRWINTSTNTFNRGYATKSKW